jgi:glyoxylase-like metal-dependent hydrolase (beta-lactamase superfamily II)
MSWNRVADGLWRYADSCSVYAIEAPEGAVIVDAGTGAWLDHADELPAKPVALLCTHFLRDHSAGAARASKAGIPVYVPEYERAIFADPEQHFRQRDTYIIYDNVWDLYAPIEPTVVAGVLRDYDRVDVAGMEFEVIPLPGATFTQIGLGVTLRDGRRAVFCGEAIHSPGKLARLAPLQYNYNDLPGGVQCSFSVQELRRRKPDLLLPSLGEPILDDADGALALLRQNLLKLLAVREPTGVGDTSPENAQQLAVRLENDSLVRVTDHVWLDPLSVANTWFVISDSGKAIAIDYGYHRAQCDAGLGYPKLERRRALLHGLDALKRQFGIDRLDAVLTSHYHDDHVCGIPLLQRLYGTECWAPENFADLLAHPDAHCFPCCWPVPAQVKRLPLDTPIPWEEYTFTLHAMNGHTRFSALIGFEADGDRYAHTGDHYFFNDWNGKSGFDEVRARAQNHVYRNGALLDGYLESGRWMLEQRPGIVIQGHDPAMFTDDAFFKHIADWNKDYADLHRLIMPLGDDDVHFNLDSWGGWIWPYRTHLASPGSAQVRVTVRNPLPRATEATVRLVGPDGWRGEAGKVKLAPRAEGSLTLSITPGGPCRRQPFAAELTVEGRCYGQVAEALMTAGHADF